MASRAIGSLFIDISARTAQIEQDMGKVKSILSGMKEDTSSLSSTFGKGFEGMEKKALKFGISMLGAQSALKLMAHEVRNAIENVEDIRGLDPQMLSSVQEFRHNIAEANNELKMGLATLAGWAQQLVNIASAKFSNFVNLAEGRDLGTLGPTNPTPDQMAADKDPKFGEKIKAAQKALKDAQGRSDAAGMDEAGKAEVLWQRYLDKIDEAGDATLNTVEKTKLLTEAENLYTQSVDRTFRLKTELTDLNRKDADVLAIRSDLFESKQTKLNDLIARQSTLTRQITELETSDGNVKIGMESKYIDLKKQQITLDEKINAAMKANGEVYHQLGNAIAEDFTQAILKGEKLGDVLKNLLHDIEAIILKKMVTQPLADFATTAISQIFSGAFAGGGDPPVGQPALIGEDGPELFVPHTAGTIIPNSALGGGGKGDTYIIDARSADRTGLDNLTSFIKRVNGSIEFRAIAAVTNMQQRRA